jgi:hypothetical protein
MTGTMMMERTGTGVQGVPGVTPTGMGVPGVSSATSNWLMVPRCTYKFEKCQGGFKVTCVCDDPMARSVLHSLCTQLQSGLYSCSCTLNGITVCHYNLTMGLCKCDVTEQGCTITCTSGDQKCGEMIQCCCDSLACLCNNGCVCCVLMNNNPICCGYSETYGKTTSTKR